MNVLLIMPDASMHKFWLFGRLKSAREAPLTLTTLAAIGSAAAPSIKFRLIDESIDSVPLDCSADLVGISVLTGTSRRAYALASHFRSRGIPVVLGGIHVTLRPNEAAMFADTIVTGMAEHIWPQVLKDFQAGSMKPVYCQPDFKGKYAEGIPTPRWDLQRNSGYMLPYTVQLTRGCRHTCDFCTVPIVWKRYQRRPVDDVIRDLRAIPARRFAINDVSPFEDVEYAKQVLRAMIPLKKKWGALATTRITDDPEVLELLRRSGCQYLLLGFESVNQQALNQIRKGFNQQADYAEVMYRLHQAKIVVQGCFVFGFDADRKDVFAATVDQVQQLKIDIPRYSIYTPYPGTRLFERLRAEGRILSYDWGDYDTMHVVYQPRHMTPVELYEGLRWAYRRTFSWGMTMRRAWAGGSRAPIILAGGLTYQKFVRRIHSVKGFEQPLNQVMTALPPDAPDEAAQAAPTNPSSDPVLTA